MTPKPSNQNSIFQRGNVHLVEEHSSQGSEQKKTRPWVIVGASPINAARSTVIAVPLSTHAPLRPPLSVEVYYNNMKVMAILDQVRALDKRRFLRFEGSLSLPEMNLIDDALRQVLAL